MNLYAKVGFSSDLEFIAGFEACETKKTISMVYKLIFTLTFRSVNHRARTRCNAIKVGFS
jgi:hypothetical protein